MSPASGHRQPGFTLLELLIAVAVLGIAMAALIGGFARYANQAAHLKSRTVALWVAHNVVTEEELKPTWITAGTRSDEVAMGGQVWNYRAVTKATDDKDLRRLDVRVFAPGVDDDDPDSPALAELTAFMSCVGRGGC